MTGVCLRCLNYLNYWSNSCRLRQTHVRASQIRSSSRDMHQPRLPIRWQKVNVCKILTSYCVRVWSDLGRAPNSCDGPAAVDSYFGAQHITCCRAFDLNFGRIIDNTAPTYQSRFPICVIKWHVEITISTEVTTLFGVNNILYKDVCWLSIGRPIWKCHWKFSKDER